MAMYAISALIVYLILSFLITTLYIRYASETSIEKIARKHIYCFPFIPILIVAHFAGVIILPVLGIASTLFRHLFEKLSGKKTYRKTRYRYYKY